MKKGPNIGLIVLISVAIVIFIGIFWFIGTFNSLVSLDETANAQWANVESSYQRRADLIPNLVSTVQGAANFEKETQSQIAALRTQAVSAKAAWDNAQGVDAKLAAAKQVESVIGAFRGLNINVERYPELKATQNFLAFQTQLEGTENRINVERVRYNEAVKNYNKKIRFFPANIVAGVFGFEKKTLFEADSGAESAPAVNFG